MVSWLVLHHLLLSQTAFKRDIDDPKTIVDLADTIQSPERLRLLLILTVADMRAVSPKVWNGWKATLLRELYARVAEVLEGGLSTTERDVRVARAKQAVAELLADWPAEAVEQFLALGYPGYWLSFDPEAHVRHARIVREATTRGAPLTIETQPMPERAVTEVIVYTADHPGLFSRIAGALAVAGASIVDARIHTMTNGMALDTFWIQDATSGSFDAPHRLARLAVLIEQALSGRLRLAREIRKMSKSLLGSRMRAIHVPPRVVIDNRASNTHTVLEVNGRDRPGLLHDADRGDQRRGAADRVRPHHHLWGARGGRVLREGRVRAEGGERAQARETARRPAQGARRRRGVPSEPRPRAGSAPARPGSRRGLNHRPGVTVRGNRPKPNPALRARAELLAHHADQFARRERLAEHPPGLEPRRQRVDVAVAGQENERHAAILQRLGDRETELARQVHVQHRPVEALLLGERERPVQPRNRAHDGAAATFERFGDHLRDQ